MTDSEIRSVLKQSPDKGQRMIFDEYCGYVYVVCSNKLKSVGTNEDIDECVSDAFAAIFRHFDVPSDINGDIRGIIGTITKRTAIDAYRRLAKKYRTTVPIDDELSATLYSPQIVDADAERSAVRNILFDCIERLGEPDSSVIVFHYFYGKTSKQIASIINMTDAAVQKRISRARGKLKKLLCEAGITEEG